MSIVDPSHTIGRCQEWAVLSQIFVLVLFACLKQSSGEVFASAPASARRFTGRLVCRVMAVRFNTHCGEVGNMSFLALLPWKSVYIEQLSLLFYGSIGPALFPTCAKMDWRISTLLFRGQGIRPTINTNPCRLLAVWMPRSTHRCASTLAELVAQGHTFLERTRKLIQHKETPSLAPAPLGGLVSERSSVLCRLPEELPPRGNCSLCLSVSLPRAPVIGSCQICHG